MHLYLLWILQFLQSIQKLLEERTGFFLKLTFMRVMKGQAITDPSYMVLEIKSEAFCCSGKFSAVQPSSCWPLPDLLTHPNIFLISFQLDHWKVLPAMFFLTLLCGANYRVLPIAENELSCQLGCCWKKKKKHSTQSNP